jgi:hypothetical protein
MRASEGALAKPLRLALSPHFQPDLLPLFFRSRPFLPTGVLVSMADGRSTLHAMGDLQSRGTFFIEPGAEVYAGMVIGESTR